ncbi:MAG TPA: hypothetical protein VGE98_08275, partial [Thermoanaerobaculia bacterium]
PKTCNNKTRVERGNPGLTEAGLTLIVRGGVNRITVEAVPCDTSPDIPNKHVDVTVKYAKWEVDGGGFYAFSRSSDEVLVTQATPQPTPTRTPKDATSGAQTMVLRRQSSQRLRSDTGVSFNFYPGNYPLIGFMFGIAANNGRSPSYYLGTGIRLLSIGHRAVASIMGGINIVQLKSFRGIAEGQSYSSSDPLLNGSVDYKTSPFLSVHLGFSIGGAASVSSGAGGPS